MCLCYCVPVLYLRVYLGVYLCVYLCMVQVPVCKGRCVRAPLPHPPSAREGSEGSLLPSCTCLAGVGSLSDCDNEGDANPASLY